LAFPFGVIDHALAMPLRWQVCHRLEAENEWRDIGFIRNAMCRGEIPAMERVTKVEVPICGKSLQLDPVLRVSVLVDYICVIKSSIDYSYGPLISRRCLLWGG
jgi:hypothetical protein